jgi:subtilisin family serine protease
MKEYIVVAKCELDIDSLHAELVTSSLHNPKANQAVVPGRIVQVANARLGNPRITHYMLSDAEAIALTKDPRVEAVHLPPKPETKVKNIVRKYVAYDTIIGNFNRNRLNDKYNVNWGQRRTSVPNAEARPGNTYDSTLDGTGVDIVIMDDGIQFDHPEFLDATGVSRVQQLDWYTATGIPGTMPPNHYVCNDYGDGEHGTLVASIAAGKTFGYAKNARIYSIRVFGSSSQVIPDADQFDLIRVWHSKKIADPKTGTKRPTIVNTSWGYAWYYSDSPWDFTPNQMSTNYRNTEYKYSTPRSPNINYGQKSNYRHGFRVPSVDAEQQDAEAAGVIFVHSAGNGAHKIDKVGGIDYNNYYTTDWYWAGIVPPGDPIYYHRGCSPSSTNAIVVSAARDITVTSNKKILEVVDSYSERGPGCDIVAPGTSITAGTSKVSSYTTSEYVWGRNNAYDRGFKVAKISGTSFAAPQVTGVLALYLSQNPRVTPAQAKAWITKVGIKNQLFTSLVNNDWKNPNALLGGPNNFLFNPYRNNYKDPKL